MAFRALGSAELSDSTNNNGGVYTSYPGGTISSTTALAGAYSYQVAPYLGNGNGQYGWTAGLTSSNTLAVMFMFQTTDSFNSVSTVCHLGSRSLAGRSVRHIDLNGFAMQIFTDADTSVGTTGAGYFAVNTAYWILYYFDQSDVNNTIDKLWVFKNGAWNLAIDAVGLAGAGSAFLNAITAVTFGSTKGKTKPTNSASFLVDEMCVQEFDRDPNTEPIGSATIRLRAPTANGTDVGFTLGTGTNPDWNDVKEVPPDNATTVDATNSANFVSYKVQTVVAGETPLAVQVIGAGSNSAAVAANTRVYLRDTAARDQSAPSTNPANAWAMLIDFWLGKTFQTFNGNTWTPEVFNTMEVGVQVVSTTATGSNYGLTAIQAEYLIVGSQSLPTGFPIPTVAQRWPAIDMAPVVSPPRPFWQSPPSWSDDDLWSAIISTAAVVVPTQSPKLSLLGAGF